MTRTRVRLRRDPQGRLGTVTTRLDAAFLNDKRELRSKLSIEGAPDVNLALPHIDHG